MGKLEETVMFRKGKIGEVLFDEYLSKRGITTPYAPSSDGKHPFDRLLVSNDKKTLFIVDVKAVSARDKYPDTGISMTHYEEYLFIQSRYNIEVWICFVDSKKGTLYGNSLDRMSAPCSIDHSRGTLKYPMVENNFTAVGGKIIYFPLAKMEIFKELSEEDKRMLESCSNYGYKKDVEWKRGFKKWQESHAALAAALAI
jgi:hypothetical protein